MSFIDLTKEFQILVSVGKRFFDRMQNDTWECLNPRYFWWNDCGSGFF